MTAVSLEMDLDEVAKWSPSIEQARDACLERRVCALNLPTVPQEHWFGEDQLDILLPKVEEAVRHGRMIDCGYLPNEVIKTGGKRGGIMYNSGLMGHPFRDPWVLYHTWDMDSDRTDRDGLCVAVYLIELHGDDATGGMTEIIELNPVMIQGRKVLCAGDHVMMETSSTSKDRYQGFSRPSTWRFAFEAMVDRSQRPRTADDLNLGTSPGGAAMANCLDPFVTALLLLHTDGIPVDRIEPPIKLNKARIKNRKPPLPSFLRINSAPYVTALMARQHRLHGQHQGGTHASPIYHWRMGHFRYFQQGQQPTTALPSPPGERAPWRIRVRDAVVNAKGETRDAFLRSHYVMK